MALPLNDELALMVLRDAYDNEEWNWGKLIAWRERAYLKRSDALAAQGFASKLTTC